MPRVEYTAAAGLVQRSGAGFALNQIETMNGAHLSVSQGTTFVNMVTANQVTLPATANAGDVCILANSAAVASVLKTDNKAGGDVTFGAIGDGAICVHNGTQWVCLVSDA